MRFYTWKKHYSRGHTISETPPRVVKQQIALGVAPTVSLYLGSAEQGAQRFELTMSKSEAEGLALEILKATGWKLEPAQQEMAKAEGRDHG